MLYKTKVFVRVIVLLYPKPSQPLLSGIIAGYKVKIQSAQAALKNLEYLCVSGVWCGFRLKSAAI